MKTKILILSLISVLMIQCHSTQQVNADLKNQIIDLFPGATVEAIAFGEPYQEAYKVKLLQFLDHNNPELGTFDQYIYLYHTDYVAPVHLETGGYDAYLTEREISKNLGLNLIIVEYRFYGESKPDNIPWEYLTNDQAVEDYHRINQAFRKIYKTGKWLISGISKGGETAMIYKSKYPEDADVVVPYVAPIILDTADVRPWELVNRVGSSDCRKKVKNLQKRLLKNKDEVLNLMIETTRADSLTFAIGHEVALEYAILEYLFSFWQWNGDCSQIPDEKASLDSAYRYLNGVSGVSNFSDQSYESGLPSYYQHMRELGYYVMDTTDLSEWLSQDRYSHRAFAPKGVDLTYNDRYMPAVKDYVENQGEQMIWIYGGLDPWGGCAVEPKGKSTMKFVKPDGTHRTRIKDLDSLQQQQIYDSLRVWLE
ncbi:MAG: S28 family serine protease [Reichenbachiella sp.]|uniref:S28 family serine protease n=1 Tax=Reichenbachiella sp. TaxID=2184521 RepID=UPI00296602DE|nr:S28 family serine protease [Reichenbachiella sp.]MDW3208271.1 S28 family serine protease [Reichenbachiella sp.]